MQTSRWLCFLALVGTGSVSAACTMHASDTAAPSTGYTQPGAYPAESGYFAGQPSSYGYEQTGYDDQVVYDAPVQTDEVVYSEDPTLVAIEPDVYVVQDADQPVYWVDNTYWRYDYPQSTWYRSPSYAGGWVSVGIGYVPPTIVSRDHHHYTHYHGDHHARTLQAPTPTYAAPPAPAPEARAPRPPPLHIGPLPGTMPNHGVAHAPPAIAPAPPAPHPNVAPPPHFVPPIVTAPSATGGGPSISPTQVPRVATPPSTAPTSMRPTPHTAPPAAPHIAPNAVVPHTAPPAAPHITPNAVVPHPAPPAAPHITPNAVVPHPAPHVAPPAAAPHVAPPAHGTRR